MENNELTIINPQELVAVTKAEIDSQIATAHAYPRDLDRVIRNVKAISLKDQDTAAGCFYSLRRGDQSKPIEGPSIRLAELVASQYGNLRIQTRVKSNDGKIIVAEAVCHDLESNYAISSEVRVSIVSKNGQTYSNDMQVVVGNAACAKAMRNAIFKVVPMVMFDTLLPDIKKTAIGEGANLTETRSKMIEYFSKMGVNQQMICHYLGVDSVLKIDAELVGQLRGLATAIKDGTTSVEETFIEPELRAEKEKMQKEVASETQQSAMDAMLQSKGGK